MSSQAWRTLLSSNLRELRFVFCQKSAHSQGVRNFIRKNYIDVKKDHPYFPFIVRECQDAIPNVMARYDFGVEKRVVCQNMSEQEIEEVIEKLVSQSKEINGQFSSYVQKQ